MRKRTRPAALKELLTTDAVGTRNGERNAPVPRQRPRNTGVFAAQPCCDALATSRHARKGCAGAHLSQSFGAALFRRRRRRHDAATSSKFFRLQALGKGLSPPRTRGALRLSRKSSGRGRLWPSSRTTPGAEIILDLGEKRRGEGGCRHYRRIRRLRSSRP